MYTCGTQRIEPRKNWTQHDMAFFTKRIKKIWIPQKSKQQPSKQDCKNCENNIWVSLKIKGVPLNLTKLIDRQNNESHESPWPTSATPMPTKHLILRPHGAQQSLQGDSHDNSAKGCKTNTIQPAKNRQHVLGGGNLQIQWKTISSTNGLVSSSDSFESHMRSSQMSDFQQKLPKIVEVEL